MTNAKRLRELNEALREIGPLQVMPGKTLVHLETGEGNERGQGEPVCSMPRKYSRAAEVFEDAANARPTLELAEQIIEADLEHQSLLRLAEHAGAVGMKGISEMLAALNAKRAALLKQWEQA